ncbi:MAG: hypothetical protein LAT64_00865 [Phycisphaerales bacterium]|nr:hypothetical protein [Planctomycetota bacterium]MCH8507313.1 hypothetical protein [Phycisphaerales bacterium]
MGEAKPWQIILVVVALGVLGFSVWRSMNSGKPELTRSVMLADVATGDLFELSLAGRRAAVYPEIHPDTGERTLMPVKQEEDGTWKLLEYTFPALQDVSVEAPAVDMTTRTVNVNQSRPRRIRL